MEIHHIAIVFHVVDNVEYPHEIYLRLQVDCYEVPSAVHLSWSNWNLHKLVQWPSFALFGPFVYVAQ